tara:strand:- start:2361 stop:2834 length:474 start_codon:yes stop_codon:yes gene_type:complete
MMPIPKLLDLIGSLHRAGLGGARKSALLSALLGGGVGAVTGSSDSRMSNFLKGSLIGGGAGAGLHMGAGRGGAAAVSSLARSVTPPTDRVAALKLMAGLGGGGAAGGALGGLGGLKLRELTRPAVAGIDVQDILSKYSEDTRDADVVRVLNRLTNRK